MECKHPYYKFVDGVLVCAQCGEPSPRASEVAKEQGIEDKLGPQPENKKIIPPEVKRQKKVVKKGRRK